MRDLSNGLESLMQEYLMSVAFIQQQGYQSSGLSLG
jgi:hypothetical protein